MSRTTVMWKTIQSPPSAIQLTFALPAPRTEGAVGVSSKHHYLLLLGDLPAHCYALGFTQQLVWSAADVMDPSRVEHPFKLKQGPSSMAHIPRVYQGLNGPCATHAMKRVVGQDPWICRVARHTLTAISSPTTQGCTFYQLPTDNVLGKAVRANLQFSCKIPLGMCNSQCQETTGNWSQWRCQSHPAIIPSTSPLSAPSRRSGKSPMGSWKLLPSHKSLGTLQLEE